MEPEKMTTKTGCLVVYPISAALLKAEMFLKKVESITTSNDLQKKFIDEIYANCKGDVSQIDEIESIADINNEKINRWLAERGFQIKLDPFGRNGFGVASMLDLIGEWAIKGKKWSVETEDGKYYPGIKMNNYGLKFHRVKDNPNFIIEIDTRSDDTVFLMMADEVPAGLALVDYIEQIMNSKMTAPFEYEGVIFPKINLDERMTLDWLIDLKLDTPSQEIPYYVIAQALQQTKLKMNEIGFRVKSAVALGILAGAAPRKTESYVINRPFLMWITRLGLSKPLFIGYLNKDVWKDPEDLEM